MDNRNFYLGYGAPQGGGGGGGDGGEQQQQQPGAGMTDPSMMNFAGYPALMQQYFQQQQQQQQLQQAAAMDPRLAGFGGFPGMAGLDQSRMLMLSQQQQWGMGAAAANMPTDPSADPYAENGILGPWSATSAGLLGKMASTSTTDPKGKRFRKKPKDRPKRPLSAYNLFFKAERARILEGIPEDKDKKDEDAKEGEEGKKEEPEATKEEGEEEGGKEGKPKKKKRPHGKIGFESLAKVIGQRWQDLAPDQVEHYKKLAEVDMKRYKQEMEVYLGKRENGGLPPAPTAVMTQEVKEEPKTEVNEDEPAAKKVKTEE